MPCRWACLFDPILLHIPTCTGVAGRLAEILHQIVDIGEGRGHIFGLQRQQLHRIVVADVVNFVRR